MAPGKEFGFRVGGQKAGSRLHAIGPVVLELIGEHCNPFLSGYRLSAIGYQLSAISNWLLASDRGFALAVRPSRQPTDS
jgi:hypothetical protein